MNERIKELINQSGIAVRGYYDESGSTPAELQKFTELIVCECVIRAEREWLRNGDTEHNRAVSKVIGSIKKHFGVEE